ncbi:MAG: right-handed parallel beta-helix repeat-containing protein, partial [Armatimonadetes bacterium]|nr:right-handed parallel beta-helix repeat-containing protein [Armatimonadota bacterium]
MLRTSPLLLLTLLAAPAHATDLPAQISGDVTLSAALSPYFLTTSTSISAGVTVTVEPGVEIIATGDFRLFVNGTLTGGSAAGAAIIFRAADAGARGAWEGLYVAPTGHLRLTNAAISNGVYGVMSPGGEITLTGCRVSLIATDALFAWGASALRCDGCEFRDNTGRGICAEGYQASGGITNCHFASHGGYPIQLKATLVEMLGSGNTFAGNTLERIGVSCSLVDDITDSDTWSRQAVPLELGAGGGDPILTVASGGQLTLAAGTTLYARRVDCKGRLDIAGGADLPVTFTAAPENRTPGVWEGLNFAPGSTGVLSHVAVAYAGTGLTTDGATLTLQDSLVEACQTDGARFTGASALTVHGTIFRNNGRCGLRLEGPGTTGTIASCQFLACGSYPIWSLAANLRCVQSGQVYAGNVVPRIGVSCGGTPDLASGEHLWRPQGLPLDCSVAGSDAVLNLASGATLIIPGGQTLYLGGLDVHGQLS